MELLSYKIGQVFSREGRSGVLYILSSVGENAVALITTEGTRYTEPVQMAEYGHIGTDIMNRLVAFSPAKFTLEAESFQEWLANYLKQNS
jgi:hypothetical protein